MRDKEKEFFTFLRSGLRRLTMRWPAKHVCLEAARRHSQSKNRRLKWEFLCSECGQWHPKKNVNVHHKLPVGTLQCYADLPGFVERLFCDVSGLTVVCLRCHDKITLKETKNRKNGKAI